MENEIKSMNKKELIKRIKEYKPKYIYQRYDGRIHKYEVVNDNYLVETKTGMSFDFRSHLMLGKVSEDLIDLIQCGDYVNGIKIISIIQQADTMKTISLCGFDNDYLDIKLNNRDIKTVVTKEMMKSIEYRVNRDMETN